MQPPNARTFAIILGTRRKQDSYDHYPNPMAKDIQGAKNLSDTGSFFSFFCHFILSAEIAALTTS
jgi:hypothetical protein